MSPLHADYQDAGLHRATGRRTCTPPTLHGLTCRADAVMLTARCGSEACGRRACLILLFSPRFSECRSQSFTWTRSCSCSRIGGCRRHQRMWNFAWAERSIGGTSWRKVRWAWTRCPFHLSCARQAARARRRDLARGALRRVAECGWTRWTGVDWCARYHGQTDQVVEECS